VIHHGGRNGEPIACAFPFGHSGEHSWATIPTFTDGMTKTEKNSDRLLNNWGEFGYITDIEFFNDLHDALKQDLEECKARTDTVSLQGTP
jgi:hypothetical protein